MDEVEITSVIREVSQGMTAPYLCEASDDNQYIVKGSKASPKELMYEWVVAHLGVSFGLPIPPFKKAVADNEFLKYGIYDLYCCNFASERQKDIQEIRFNQLEALGNNILKDLFFFDYWIQNDDRNLTERGGNPNFFVHQKTLEPFVLDHNLAFNKDFSLAEHKLYHVGAKFWNGLDLIDREDYEKRIRKCTIVLDKAFKSLPKDWLENDPNGSIEASIRSILNRVNEDEFWEGIK
ncbi:hypothetical protein TUM4438_43560 [Shewanella sairae]|uniref:HipA-like kinase domain-containing protein n=1 Tax=Shewanella sairae TaxID=190310 RepID=A0ABQ4PR89_9GAMM|nr:HipA family kinase [Shewanella sairae]MCL1132462.1 hypothetical protein [Shewanella sairae]GIU52015.1 hypothetical protein TUM4438_43560 [Shewanella sairae]